MDDAVVDTSVLIDLSRSRQAAEAFIARWPSSRWLLHPVTEAELPVGAVDRDDQSGLTRRFRTVRRLRVLSEDFDHRLAFVRRYTLSHGTDWPDFLIAATALRLRLPVVTLNDRHFRPIRGLRVIRPY